MEEKAVAYVCIPLGVFVGPGLGNRGWGAPMWGWDRVPAAPCHSCPSLHSLLHLHLNALKSIISRPGVGYGGLDRGKIKGEVS